MFGSSAASPRTIEPARKRMVVWRRSFKHWSRVFAEGLEGGISSGTQSQLAMLALLGLCNSVISARPCREQSRLTTIRILSYFISGICDTNTDRRSKQFADSNQSGTRNKSPQLI
jgi:hypothetical protein